jgi:hypothetical protein
LLVLAEISGAATRDIADLVYRPIDRKAIAVDAEWLALAGVGAGS